jgi:hypothetical protein
MAIAKSGETNPVRKVCEGMRLFARTTMPAKHARFAMSREVDWYTWSPKLPFRQL